MRSISTTVPSDMQFSQFYHQEVSHRIYSGTCKIGTTSTVLTIPRTGAGAPSLASSSSTDADANARSTAPSNFRRVLESVNTLMPDANRRAFLSHCITLRATLHGLASRRTVETLHVHDHNEFAIAQALILARIGTSKHLNIDIVTTYRAARLDEKYRTQDFVAWALDETKISTERVFDLDVETAWKVAKAKLVQGGITLAGIKTLSHEAWKEWGVMEEVSDKIQGLIGPFEEWEDYVVDV